MRQILTKILAVMLLAINFYIDNLHAQTYIKIVDSETHQPIPYATIYDATKSFGKIANNEGDVLVNPTTFNEENGVVTIYVSAIGYEEESFSFDHSKLQHTVPLKPKIYEISDVTINAKKLFAYEHLNRVLKTSFIDFNNHPLHVKYSIEISIYLNDSLIAFSKGYVNYKPTDNNLQNFYEFNDTIVFDYNFESNKKVYTNIIHNIVMRDFYDLFEQPHLIFVLNPLRFTKKPLSNPFYTKNNCRFDVSKSQNPSLRVINTKKVYVHPQDKTLVDSTMGYFFIDRETNRITEFLSESKISFNSNVHEIISKFQYSIKNGSVYIKSAEYLNHNFTHDKKEVFFKVKILENI